MGDRLDALIDPRDREHGSPISKSMSVAVGKFFGTREVGRIRVAKSLWSPSTPERFARYSLHVGSQLSRILASFYSSQVNSAYERVSGVPNLVTGDRLGVSIDPRDRD